MFSESSFCVQAFPYCMCREFAFLMRDCHKFAANQGCSSSRFLRLNVSNVSANHRFISTASEAKAQYIGSCPCRDYEYFARRLQCFLNERLSFVCPWVGPISGSVSFIRLQYGFHHKGMCCAPIVASQARFIIRHVSQPFDVVDPVFQIIEEWKKGVQLFLS